MVDVTVEIETAAPKTEAETERSEVAAEGDRTLIMVTHDPALAAGLSRTFDGTDLVASGEPAPVVEARTS